jgi:hypothetical protein
MTSTASRCSAVALVALAASACAADANRIWGNVEPTYSLDFDEVRAYRLGNLLVIAYEKEFDPPGFATSLGQPVMNQVVRLSLRQDLVDASGAPLVQVTREIHLEQRAKDASGRSARIGALERYVVEVDGKGDLADGAGFPELQQATVSFSELGDKPGQELVGRFAARFLNDRTLQGEFDTRLVAP